MQAAGYQYVNIDDCWMNGRDASGNLRGTPPSSPTASRRSPTYVHSKGLKLGIYESPAHDLRTCAGTDRRAAASATRRRTRRRSLVGRGLPEVRQLRAGR